MTVTDVASHFGLDWKTVKNIDKHFLEKEFSKTDYSNLRSIVIDEIAVRKSHKYYAQINQICQKLVFRILNGYNLLLLFLSISLYTKNILSP